MKKRRNFIFAALFAGVVLAGFMPSSSLAEEQGTQEGEGTGDIVALADETVPTYKVGNATEYNTAITSIGKQSENEAVIILSSSYSGTNPTIKGVAGKHITLQSEGDTVQTVRLYDGNSLVGDVTFDNVKISFGSTSMPEFYANGHLFETTLQTVTDFPYASTAMILYGGGYNVDVSGDTNIIIRSGTFKDIYGGGYNGDVTGDVNITIGSETGEPAEKPTIQSFYGGGASSTATAIISGNVNIKVLSGRIENQLYGGGRTSGGKTDDDSRDVAAVKKNVNVTIGYPGIPEDKISALVYAGSYNSSVNAVELHTYTKGNYYGAGSSDTVYDTITIIAEGTGEGRSSVYGSGINSASGPIRIGKNHSAENGPVVQITYSYETTHASNWGSVYTSNGAQTEIYGDVRTEIPENTNVKLGVLSLGAAANERTTLDIQGKSELVINSTVSAAYVQGDRKQVDTNGVLARTFVIVNEGVKLTTGTFQYCGTIDLLDRSETVVNSYNFTNYFFTSTAEKGVDPFQLVYNLQLEDGAKLDTRNVAATLRGNATLGDALWIMRGRMTINGNLSMDKTKLQIPAVVPGQNYGTTSYIALKVEGQGSGTGDVTLMDKTTWTEAVPTTGDNYILINKTNAPAQDDIVLANTNAGGKYFARVDDALGRNYYMWQVAEPGDAVTIYPETQTIYTGGEDGFGENGEFPYPIYLDQETGKEIAEDMKFKVNGTEWNDPDNEYPFTVRYYEKEEDGQTGAEITDDEHYGDFIARIVPVAGVDVDSITTEDGNSVAFADGTLRIRYVSQYTEASENNLTTSAVEYKAGDEDSAEQAKDSAEELAEKNETVSAVLPDDTDILLNGNEDYSYAESTPAQIALFCDELLPASADGDSSEYEKMLDDRAEEENYVMEGWENMYRYLDLVDVNNSNAWVASTEGTDVFWPYPEGVDKDSDIRLLHFQGLHREYRMDGEGSGLQDQVDAAEIEDVKIVEKTDKGIWFHVEQSGFSPYVLSWKDGNTGGGQGGEEPDKENPPARQPGDDVGQNVKDQNANTGRETVRTSDEANVGLWTGMMTVSGLLAIFILISGRRRKA